MKRFRANVTGINSPGGGCCLPAAHCFHVFNCLEFEKVFASEVARNSI
jgi:hypothetical protein